VNQNPEFDRRDAFILMTMAFGFGVLFSWGAFYQWGSLPVAKPVDLPAWTQAVGSILAICLAVYVPWQQRRYQIVDAQLQDERARAEQREFIKVMQLALIQAVSEYVSHCEFMQREFKQKKIVRAVIPETIFRRPPEFDQFRTKLHLMGALGHRVNKLITHQDLVRGMHGEFMRLSEPMPTYFLSSYKERTADGAKEGNDLYDHLKDAIRVDHV